MTSRAVLLHERLDDRFEAVLRCRRRDRGVTGEGERHEWARAHLQNEIRPETNMERLFVGPPLPPYIVPVICPNWAEVVVVFGSANCEWLATLYRSPRSWRVPRSQSLNSRWALRLKRFSASPRHPPYPLMILGNT